MIGMALSVLLAILLAAVSAAAYFQADALKRERVQHAEDIAVREVLITRYREMAQAATATAERAVHAFEVATTAVVHVAPIKPPRRGDEPLEDPPTVRAADKKVARARRAAEEQEETIRAAGRPIATRVNDKRVPPVPRLNERDIDEDEDDGN